MPHLWGRANAYPLPRKREALPAAPGEPPPLALPRSRSWSIALATGGPDLRATGVSPGFEGPAILRQLVLFNGVAALAAGKNSGIELYYSDDDSGAGTGQAISPPPSGTPIFENFGDPTQAAKFQTDAQLLTSGPLTSTARPVMWDLHHLIRPSGRFFLKASIVSGSGVAVTDWGLALALFERVDPDLIPDFL